MRQVRNQTPTKAVVDATIAAKFPGMHPCRVEKESPKNDYVSPMEEMLAQGYEVLSENRADTGHSRMVLLGVPDSQFDAVQKANEAAALESVARSSPMQERGTWESTEIGAAMTIGQLEASIGKVAPPQ